MVYYWIGKATVCVALLTLVFILWFYIISSAVSFMTIILIMLGAFLFGFVGEALMGDSLPKDKE